MRRRVLSQVVIDLYLAAVLRKRVSQWHDVAELGRSAPRRLRQKGSIDVPIGRSQRSAWISRFQIARVSNSGRPLRKS
jgi:hypothetical protein